MASNAASVFSHFFSNTKGDITPLGLQTHPAKQSSWVHATIARLRVFQLENTLGRSSLTGVFG